MRKETLAFLLLIPGLMPLLAFPADEPEVRFTSGTTLVMLPVKVVDRRDSFVAGLHRDAFRVIQDNLEHPIVSFAEEDAPVSQGIVFDTSGSMISVLTDSKRIMKSLLSLANGDDEAFLNTVSSQPGIDHAFTSDFGSLLERSAFLQADGATALVDSIYAAVQTCRSGRNQRKAVVVISDGMDNHSRHSKQQLFRMAEEADVQIFTLSVFAPPAGKKPIEWNEERDGLFFLEELARRTGGASFVVRDRSEIEKTAVQVARLVRTEYLIGYRADSGMVPGSWHSVQVKVALPDARAYTRTRLLAP